MCGVLLVAAALAAVIFSAGPGSTPAYALKVVGDGTVELTVNDIVGVGPANARLAQLGIPAVVQTNGPGCSGKGAQTVSAGKRGPLGPLGLQGIVQMTSVPGGGVQAMRWIIKLAAIPHGDTLGLAAQLEHTLTPQHGAVTAVGGSLGLYRGKAPTCTQPR